MSATYIWARVLSSLVEILGDIPVAAMLDDADAMNGEFDTLCLAVKSCPDRLKKVNEWFRKQFPNYDAVPEFDEGELRKRSLFMWPGKLRTIRFEFSGPSVQAVLDKLPTAKIIERLSGNKYLIEAETYGDGIKMWLLSQGSWVKVTEPDDFVSEMKKELEIMRTYYT